MKHDVIVIISALGVAGQALAVLLLAIGLLAVAGVRGPLELVETGQRLRNVTFTTSYEESVARAIENALR